MKEKHCESLRQSLTKEILGQYATYPRKIFFIKKQRDLVKEKLITDYMRIALLFCPECFSIKESMRQYLSSLVVNHGEATNRCLECGSENILDETENTNAVCMCCGLEQNNMQVAYRDNATMTATRTPIYDRAKHFRELVATYQGKLTRSIESEVIEKLK